MLHLMSVSCLFDKDRLVPLRCRHMRVEVTQKFLRIAVGEIVVSANEHGSVRVFFRLVKSCPFFDVLTLLSSPENCQS